MAESTKVICVSTWGDPSQWRLANYKFDKEAIADFSTLGILRKLKKPDGMLMVTSDTLAAKGEGKPSSYGDIVNAAKAYVEKYLCGASAEVVVLPGVMRVSREAGPEYVFHADLQDYRTIFLYEVYRRAVELASVGWKLVIVLDISHGVNYMPVLALDAVQEAATMVAVAFAGAVKLEVYQADPYPVLRSVEAQKLGRSEDDPCRPSGDTEPPELSYNCIRTLTAKPWSLVRYIAYSGEGRKRLLTDHRGLEGDIVKLVKQALAILGAFRLGALTQLVTLVREGRLEGFENALQNAVSLWRSKRGIEEKGGTLIIKSGTKFQEGFRALLNAHSVVAGVSKLLGSTEGEGVRFSELKNLFEQLLAGSLVTKTLVKRELSKLDDLKGRLSGEWRLYSDYSKQDHSACESKPDFEIIKRDFIAHAGFHSDMLEVRLSNEWPEVRVRKDCWETTKRILEEVASGA